MTKCIIRKYRNIENKEKKPRTGKKTSQRSIPSSTLLIKILLIFQNSITMPFLRRLSRSCISIDVLFVLQWEYLYSALHSQNRKKKICSKGIYQNQCWNKSGSGEEIQGLFPAPHALRRLWHSPLEVYRLSTR